MVAQVTYYLSAASQWGFPFAKRAGTAASRIKNIALYYLSSKQSMRQDSLLATIQSLSPNVRGFMTLQYWRLCSFFKENACDKEAKLYFRALGGIKKLSVELQEALTPEEKASLSALFKKGLLDPTDIEKYHLLFIFKNLSGFDQPHMILQKMVRMHREAYFNALCLKIESVTRCLEGQDVEENRKLELIDCSMIGSAPSMCDLIESLQRQGIVDLDRLLFKWQTVRAFTQSSSFSALNKLCFESRSPGSIFLGDWQNYETIFGHGYDCGTIVKRLFMGPWGHIGIRVRLEEGQSAVSHVNSGSKNHAISPTKNELAKPFYHSLDLNIQPLIPETVERAHCQELQKVFSQAFHRLALEHHPELYIGSSKDHLSVLLLGHQSFFSQPLSEVNLPNNGERILCSGYVGIIFLKSIQEVNTQLQRMGYKERIAHPFGSHESIARLDVLRLIYLWNRLKIIKETPSHPTIAKVMRLPRPIDLSGFL